MAGEQRSSPIRCDRRQIISIVNDATLAHLQLCIESILSQDFHGGNQAASSLSNGETGPRG